MSLISELKRRNVFRMAAGYLAVSWLLVQVIETLLPIFGFSENAVRYTVIALAVGFIPALVVSWAFEWTPEGLVRDDQAPADSPARVRTAKTWDRIILVVLAAAVGLFAFERFVITPEREAALVEAATEAGIEMGRSEASEIPNESVAVLPFVNMSADPDNEYFSDGLTDTLLHMLAQLNDLKVAARTSSFAFKGKNEDIRTIAEALSVAHVLEGSVQRANDSMRVTAQLIRAADGYHVWSRNFDRNLDDIFAIQDEIAAEVAIALGSSLLASDSDAIAGVATTDVAAYDLYLRGQNELRTGTYDSLLEAELLLGQAIEQDPGFIEARLALARTAMQQMGQGINTYEEGMFEAERLVGEVLGEHPDSLGARQFEALLNIYRVTWDQMNMTQTDAMIDEMLPLFDEGVGLPYARQSAAYLLAQQERHDEALRLVQQALVTDPLNLELLSAHSNILRDLGRFEEALVPLMKQREIEPDNAMVYFRLGNLERARSRYADALPYLKQHALMDSSSPQAAWFLADLFNDAGLYEEADRWYDIFEARNPDEIGRLSADIYKARARNDDAALHAVVTDGLERTFSGEIPPEMLGPLGRFYAQLAHEDGRSQEALDFIESHYPGISDIGNYEGSSWLVYRLQYYGVLPLLLDLNDDEGDAEILRVALANSDSYGVDLEDFSGWYLEFEYLQNGLEAGKAVFMERYADNADVFDTNWALHIETPWLAGLREDPQVAAVIAAREERIAEIREEMRAVIERPEWRDDIY